MVYSFKTNLNILILFCFITLVLSQNNPLISEEVQGMERIGSTLLSPDGKYLIYTINKWNKETGKTYTNIRVMELSTKNKGYITPIVEGQSDSGPTFSKSFPDYLFFQRSGKILYIPFPPEEISIEIKEDKSQVMAEYLLSINDFKIKKNLILFNSDVYFSCKTMECSKDLIDKETSGYQVYTSLFMFHWDSWLIEGKGSHIFYQTFSFDETTKKFNLEGTPIDITQGMEAYAPPIDSGSENYDISNDGTKISFSAHLRNHVEAWSTSWHTYYIDIKTMSNPILITKHTQGRTQAPKFSLDGTKIAYLSMKTPMMESENLHFEIYNILTNKIYIVDDLLDISVNDFYWENDNLIYFDSTVLGQNKIFSVDLSEYQQPVFSIVDTKSRTASFSLPFKAANNKNVKLAKKYGYNCPTKIVTFPNDETVLDPNEELFKSKELPGPIMFNFVGGYNDTVYGWIIKPIGFETSKKYPAVLLIHGGPEGSWTTDWSYRWNPTLYAQQGYVVIMINPHGSTGVNSKFQNAVRNDWGGVPYEDLIKGVNYVIQNYDFVDGDKICAAGGSFGGYMINWINGHTDIFKCLVNHDGDFSEISTFYSSDEIWFQKTEFCPFDKTGCNPFDGKEIRDGYEKNSPERFVKNWKTPMLIIHGGKDMRVHLTEGLQAFTSLQLNNIESEFLYFPLENHWTTKPENQVQWHKSVIGWLDKHLKTQK